MKVGDLVMVKVIGLGSYMRKLHSEPALIIRTHDSRGVELKRWQILWGGGTREMEPNLLVPLEPVQPDPA